MVGSVCHVTQFFSQERLKVADDARAGCPVEIPTEATVLQGVEELIQADRRIMIDSVATALACSHGLAYSIMHDCLKFWEVCRQWVPRELKDQEKVNQMCLSLQHILQYADDGEDTSMLNRIVTRMNHECITTNPNQSMLQCNGNIPVHLQPKSLRLQVCCQLGRLCLPGFSGSIVSPFSEAW
jgi:hypothetical protein